MQASKQIILGLALLILSFALGTQFQSKSQTESHKQGEPTTEINPEVSTQFETKYKDLLALGDSPEKCERAQKMLGEAMLLFISDIGLRAQILALNQNSTDGSTQVSEPLPTAVGNTSASQNAAESEAVPQPSNATVADAAAATEMQPLNEGLSDPQLQKFLNLKMSKDFRIEILNLRPMPAGVIEKLNRSLQGEVIFFDTNKSNLKVALRVQKDPGSTNQGEFNLTISGEGTNSETNGRGEFGNLFSDPAEKAALIVSGCGGDCYMQLFTVRKNQKEHFIGNFYQKDSKSLKYLATGRVTLN